MDDAAKIASLVVVESVIEALRVRHNAIIILPAAVRLPAARTAQTSMHRHGIRR